MQLRWNKWEQLSNTTDGVFWTVWWLQFISRATWFEVVASLSQSTSHSLIKVEVPVLLHIFAASASSNWCWEYVRLTFWFQYRDSFSVGGRLCKHMAHLELPLCWAWCSETRLLKRVLTREVKVLLCQWTREWKSCIGSFLIYLPTFRRRHLIMTIDDNRMHINCRLLGNHSEYQLCYSTSCWILRRAHSHLTL